MGQTASLDSWKAGLVTRSGEETERAAEAFAVLLPTDTALALSGDLGAGKTTFVRGLARGLGYAGDVTSPSFSLLNVLEGRRRLLHVDAYRLKTPEAFDGLMVWDLAKTPWNLVVEWPERVAGRLPADAWSMEAEMLPDGTHRYRLTTPS
ncbi:MAG: tRNA (adenosine(37)-N6)-threonylcarbamoyltransferase complex ATPase subunit type 1 TsaE [Verrucomicrobiota bacterium]